MISHTSTLDYGWPPSSDATGQSEKVLRLTLLRDFSPSDSLFVATVEVRPGGLPALLMLGPSGRGPGLTCPRFPDYGLDGQ